MGNLFQKSLQSFGVSESIMKFFFQSTIDKVTNAIVQGQLEIVMQLHKQYEYDFGIINYGMNSLMLAVKHDRFAIVEYIIEHNLKIIDDKDQLGDSPLMYATLGKQLHLIKLLVERGANINSRENGGASIFIAACVSGEMEIISYLFTSGANVYIKNNEGQTALHRACHYNQIKVVNFLLKNTKLSLLTKDKMGSNCFHISARNMHISLLRYMLKRFKKQAVLQIQNGENQSALDILVIHFNFIKDDSYKAIDESQVLQFLTDKEMPPEINHETKQKRESYKQLKAGQKRKTFVQRLIK